MTKKPIKSAKRGTKLESKPLPKIKTLMTITYN